MIKAFSEVFNTTTQRGCFFHFSQCIMQSIQSNNLKRRYESDAEFALSLRMLSALAFVPAHSVIEAFEELCDSNIIPPEAQPVVDYMEDTWIGRPDRRLVRRPPQFPHGM